MREKVLRLRKEGKTYKEITKILHCSEGMVYYYLNPNVKDQTNKRTLLRRYKIRRKYKMWAGGKCKNCGYDKCLDALCFHHLDPSKKEFELGTAIMQGLSDSRIKKEIKKCLLVCSNCHYELHSKEHEYQSV